MNPTAVRLLRVPVTVAAIWAALAVTVPILMARYAPYVMRPGFACVRNPVPGPDPDPAVYEELDHLRADLAELQERVDFAERLLAKPTGAAEGEPQ